MRKLVIATAVTIILAGSASAAPDSRTRERDPRNGDTPIVKMVKSIKRGLGIILTGLPSIPNP